MNYLDWYYSLNKPSWAPKDTTIGTIWSLLYPIIIAANVYVIVLLVKHKISYLVALPFWINLFFNALFTPIQFGLRNNALAMVDIYLILVTIIWAMIAIWPTSKIVAFAFVPYLIWVSIATVLHTYITFHN